MEAGRTPRVALKKKGRVIPSLFASNHTEKKEKRRAHLRARSPCPFAMSRRTGRGRLLRNKRRGFPSPVALKKTQGGLHPLRHCRVGKWMGRVVPSPFAASRVSTKKKEAIAGIPLCPLSLSTRIRRRRAAYGDHRWRQRSSYPLPICVEKRQGGHDPPLSCRKQGGGSYPPVCCQSRQYRKKTKGCGHTFVPAVPVYELPCTV